MFGDGAAKAETLKAPTKKFRNTWFGKNSTNIKRFLPLIPTVDNDKDNNEDDEEDDEEDDDDEIDDDDHNDEEDEDSESEEEELAGVPVTPNKVTKKRSIVTPIRKKASKMKKKTRKAYSPPSPPPPREDESVVSSPANKPFLKKQPSILIAGLKSKIILLVNADRTYGSLFVVSLDNSNLSWVSDFASKEGDKKRRHFTNINKNPSSFKLFCT